MPKKLPKGPSLYLKLEFGTVICRLFHEVAPNHVKRITELVKEGLYDGVVFHRVIEGFMAQTGDVMFGNKQSNYLPERCGTGGSEKPDLFHEFSDFQFDRGVLGMARSEDPNSANSQFFIMLKEGHFLNGNYTVIGKVTKGMKFVDQIKKGNSNDNGSVDNPDIIVSALIKK